MDYKIVGTSKKKSHYMNKDGITKTITHSTDKIKNATAKRKK